MGKRRSSEATVQSAWWVEVGRLAQQQSEQAIQDSLKLLRIPLYPDDQPSGRNNQGSPLVACAGANP